MTRAFHQDARQLATAETAFAAIDDADKLAYVRYVKDIPSEEGRAAELAAYRQRPEEAEAILLQARGAFFHYYFGCYRC